MANPGFTLVQLSVEGANVPPARLAFVPGLNVICGASNTGKSYVLGCLDFMLGGGDPPKSFPENEKYSEAFLTIRLNSGRIITLRRSLAGGAFLAHEGARDSANGKGRELSPKHSATSEENVSMLLLRASGLAEQLVRKDKFGGTNSVSFRHIAHLTLVDESKIISTHSPALTEGNHTAKTVEESIFQLLITGRDDSGITQEEKPKDRRARLTAQVSILEDLLKEKLERLARIVKQPEEIGALTLAVDEKITQATTLISTHQQEISRLEKTRETAWRSLQDFRVRHSTVQELLSRFSLLGKHYDSDLARLGAMTEASSAFGGMAKSACSECGRPLAKEGSETTSGEDLKALGAACAAETKKIRLLKTDLEAAATDLSKESSDLTGKIDSANSEYATANRQILESLHPHVRAGQKDLAALLTKKTDLKLAQTIVDEIAHLKKKQSAAKAGMKEKGAEGSVKEGVEVKSAVRFCEAVAELLRAWHYPNLETVSWDPKRDDLVINSQNRGDLGKGYRAFTHAAFNIGLMQYCRTRGLPHPGNIVLDTPLNPLKEADGAEGEISTEMKDSFYTALSKQLGLDQVVVLENYDPPPKLQAKINYVHFSGKRGHGRYGFFPV